MIDLPTDLMRPIGVTDLPKSGICSGGCAYELKIDGWRAVAATGPRASDLYSWAGRRLQAYFPDVIAAVEASLPPATIIDGELAIWDSDRDRTWFPWLSRRITAGRNLLEEIRAHPAHLVAFDLLQTDGLEVVDLPHVQRRQMLEAVLADAPPVLALCPQTLDRQEVAAWMADAAFAGVDGVVVKGLGDPYRPGRTR